MLISKGWIINDDGGYESNPKLKGISFPIEAKVAKRDSEHGIFVDIGIYRGLIMNEELKVLSDEECNFYWGDTIKVYITSWYVDNSTNELKLNLVLKDNSLKME